ncbi:MAG: hypothetical protein EOP04_11175 [Proteobacteria bacterium]|nr:MAG: hypothetical protein EOP04_11175 [Pseudomonadota bacterium]
MSHPANPIDHWYSTDERIREVIDRLSFSGKSEAEQAAQAFEELSHAFDLPKYPEDFTDDHYQRFSAMGVDDPLSVFEQNALINYLEPNDDPRGRTLFALYCVNFGKQLPWDEIAKKHFGGKRKIPKEYIVCFFGTGIDGEVRFLKDGESWVELGARSATKVSNPPSKK